MSEEHESPETARQNELSQEGSEPDRSDVERVEDAAQAASQAIVKAIETGSGRFWAAQVEATKPKNPLVGSMMFVASTWVVFFAIFSALTLMVGWFKYHVDPLHSLSRIAHEQEQQQRQQDQTEAKEAMGDFYVGLGKSLLDVGQAKAAEAEFEKALELDPFNPQAQMGTLKCDLFESVETKGYDPAVIQQKLDKLVEERPEDTHAYAFRGFLRYLEVDPYIPNVKEKRELYKPALSDFKKAIKLNGSNAYAYRGKSSIYYELGRFAKNLENAKKAYHLAPHDPAYKHSYANALYANKRYKDATRVYKEATVLDPQFLLPYHDLAQVYRLRGDLENSNSYYEQVLAMLENKETMSLSKNQLVWSFSFGSETTPVYLYEVPEQQYYVYYSIALTAYLRGYTADAESYMHKANDLQIDPTMKSEATWLMHYDIEKLQEEQPSLSQDAGDFDDKYIKPDL